VIIVSATCKYRSGFGYLFYKFLIGKELPLFLTMADFGSILGAAIQDRQNRLWDGKGNHKF